MVVLNLFINNDFIETKEIVDNIFIKTISVFKTNNNLEEYVKKFINIRTFPYINTDYGRIIEDYFYDLPTEKKIEVIGHLEALLKSLNDTKKAAFMKKTDKELIELTEADELELKDKEELFNSFKGGEYAEMFLCQMLYSLGFEKILSKLNIQWGELSPTGIDVPYINIQNKILVLCESKFWKNFNSAFKSIKKDIDDIIDKDKFDKEILEWKKRVSSMPTNVKNWYIKNDNQVWSKTFFENEFKIVVLGVTICNNINYEKIKKYVKDIFGEDQERKYKVILIAIPIEDKNHLICLCEKCVRNILNEVKSND